MTHIDFYTHVDDPLTVATRIAAKALAQGNRVRILTPDAEATDAVGKILWTRPSTGFFPHCRIGHRLANETPIWLDHVLDHPGPAQILINLHPDTPPFFSRFERVAEIVATDEEAIITARERWKFYKARGYEMRSHNLGATS